MFRRFRKRTRASFRPPFQLFLVVPDCARRPRGRAEGEAALPLFLGRGEAGPHPDRLRHPHHGQEDQVPDLLHLQR